MARVATLVLVLLLALGAEMRCGVRQAIYFFPAEGTATITAALLGFDENGAIQNEIILETGIQPNGCRWFPNTYQDHIFARFDAGTEYVGPAVASNGTYTSADCTELF